MFSGRDWGLGMLSRQRGISGLRPNVALQRDFVSGL